MFRDLAAQRAAERGPDARGEQEPATGHPSATALLRPYYRDRAGWGDASGTTGVAGAAGAAGSPQRSAPSQFAMSYPPLRATEANAAGRQRPPARGDDAWAWTPAAAPRDQYHPSREDYECDGRPSDRWRPVATGQPASDSTSDWATRPGLDRGFRDSMDRTNDFYLVRGDSSRDWAVTSGHRFEWRSTESWPYADAIGGDAGNRQASPGSVKQDELVHGAESKRETVTAQRKRPYRQENNQQQQQQEDTEAFRQQASRDRESNAISRPSGIHATLHSYASTPSQGTPDHVSVASGDSPMTPSDSVEGKTSRYLREIDRRNILARIESGEKQSELAKEFHVTRAAICNLKKHRDVILSRAHANPYAKHPKKSKLKPGSNQQQQQLRPVATASTARKSSAAGHAAIRRNPLVLQVASRPALLHIQRLSDPTSTSRDFRRVCRRLMALLVEEALAWVETAAFKRKSAKNSAPDPAISSDAVPDSHESRDACGVTVQPDTPLFASVFRSVEPEAPVGSIHFGDFDTSSSLSTAGGMDVDVDLPPELSSSHVYLLHTVVTLARSARIAQAVRTLIDRGTGEAFVCLVTVCVSAEALAELQSAFPLLKVATTHVDHAQAGLNRDDRAVDQLAVRVAQDADADADES